MLCCRCKSTLRFRGLPLNLIYIVRDCYAGLTMSSPSSFSSPSSLKPSCPVAMAQPQPFTSQQTPMVPKLYADYCDSRELEQYSNNSTQQIQKKTTGFNFFKHQHLFLSGKPVRVLPLNPDCDVYLLLTDSSPTTKQTSRGEYLMGCSVGPTETHPNRSLHFNPGL